MNFEDETTLVTGYGFVGKYLVDELLESGAEVIVLEKSLSAIDDIPQEASILQSDIQYYNESAEFDYVFHLAGIANTRYAEDNPMETYNVNVLGTLNLLRQLQINKKLIFTSTAVVYGSKSDAISEEASPDPPGIYGGSKLAAEELLNIYNKNNNLKYLITRLFNLYGPGQSTSYVVPELIEEAVQNNEITLMNGSAKRDFIHVKDAVNALLILAKSGYKNEIINIGSGKGISILELAKSIQGCMEGQIKIKDQQDPNPSSPELLRADNDKLSKTEWSPEIDLESGMEGTVNYYNPIFEDGK